MKWMHNQLKQVKKTAWLHKKHYKSCIILIIALLMPFSLAANSIEFNSDLLDVGDQENYDLSLFANKDFILPGKYDLGIKVNKRNLPNHKVTFLLSEYDPNVSVACIAPQLVSNFGLKPENQRKLTWWNQGRCLDVNSLPGLQTRTDLGKNTLYVSIPQAYLEYTHENWDPPSQWEEGVTGAILDYSITTRANNTQNVGTNYSTNANGVVGFNVAEWRFRADWQGNYTQTADKVTSRTFDLNRYYAYRAIKPISANLSIGENYLSSNIFDSFRFTGASLESSDEMLPPNLQGYAPEVTGIASSNATVIIKQQGNLLSETQVAAGPFRIQDLDSSTRGRLDVEVKEQDGTTKKFEVDTATIPYLTRPGRVRYKVNIGKPSDFKHKNFGPLFAISEFSWGVSNGWSLYGGAVLAGNYNSAALGLGQDLSKFGAISLDITQSLAKLPDKKNLTGGSYRLSYSKRFEEYNSQITFAGYRFSQRNFMNMSQYLERRYQGENSTGGAGKELYTIIFNKNFESAGVSGFFNYNHQTYWDKPSRMNYNVSLSRSFNIGGIKNINTNLSLYYTKQSTLSDKGVMLSLSIPFGESGSFSYDSNYNSGVVAHNVGYSDQINNQQTYRLSADVDKRNPSVSGFYSYKGQLADVSVTASSRSKSYHSVAATIQGGVTVTQHGLVLHRNGSMGGTRIMVDTDDIPDIPITIQSNAIKTNMLGQNVLTGVNSYYRQNIRVEADKLPKKVQVSNTTQYLTLTKGAIGFRQFDVIAGEQAMLQIEDHNGVYPPFGAVIFDDKNREVGIVSDSGRVWLSGIRAGHVMKLYWNNMEQGVIRFPDVLPEQLYDMTLIYYPENKIREVRETAGP